MYNYIYSAAYYGIQGYILKVEAHIARGLPRFKIVGLPDKSVEESKERVTAAIKSSGFTFPLKRITINLAPSDITKHGPTLDLAIALSILLASGQISCGKLITNTNAVFCGELGLDGAIKSIRGGPICLSAVADRGFMYFVSPPIHTHLNTGTGIITLAPRTLKDTISFLQKDDPIRLKKYSSSIANIERPEKEHSKVHTSIIGCASELRALSISVAGHHNISLYGPPGCGKTMLAQSVLSLVPYPNDHDFWEREPIYSVTKETNPNHPPLRQPQPSISLSGMIGGGQIPVPGEVSLAHTGFLFLDEFPEFSKQILASLKKVLETKESIIIHRGNRLTFPADFTLITAMNRCPCGHLGHPVKPCHCTPLNLARYHLKISHAVWDRIEMHLDMKTLYLGSIRQRMQEVDIRQLRDKISTAVDLQKKRGIRNDRIPLSVWASAAPMTSKARALLDESYRTLELSTRRLLNTIRVARTIADLETSEIIQEEHLAESLSYRKIDF